jgi:hypothetical protein
LRTWRVKFADPIGRANAEIRLTADPTEVGGRVRA